VNFSNLEPDGMVTRNIYLFNHRLKGNIRWETRLNSITITGPDGRQHEASEFIKLEVR
jgi:hypothetical protein